MNRLSRFAVLPAVVALGAGLSADTAPRTPPSAVALATGQYACRLVNVADTHQQPENATEPRDTLYLTLQLTPNPKLVEFLAQHPNGNAKDLHWLSPRGAAFQRTGTPLPDSQRVRRVGGNAYTPTFHDVASPTGDDLNPTFALTPSEKQPKGAIDDVYLENRVEQPTADGKMQTTIGYTLCGSIHHDDPFAWSQSESGPAAVPSFVVTSTSS